VNLRRSEAIVNSPSTTANVRNEALITPTLRFGKITDLIVRTHPAPSDRDASTSVLSSIELNPTSSERNENGSEIIT
jgi:hypothetical protein